MGVISIDYVDALYQASRLDTAARQCEDAESAVKNANNTICDSWQGAAAGAFKQELEEWQRENADIAEELETIAKRIRKVAKSIKEADEKAAASFE